MIVHSKTHGGDMKVLFVIFCALIIAAVLYGNDKSNGGYHSIKDD